MADGPVAASQLVFATRNDGKLTELTALLDGTGWSVERLPLEVADYEETGETFADNARGKALFAAAQLDCPVLADDSGLEIDALGGEPGVHSARYVDAALSTAERNRAVLEKLAGTPAERRTARFVCHLALALSGDIVHETTATCSGSIGFEPRGDRGFGYDPIFVVADLGATFAQIGGEEKSARSHRGAATREMVAFLNRWTRG